MGFDMSRASGEKDSHSNSNLLGLHVADFTVFAAILLGKNKRARAFETWLVGLFVKVVGGN